MPQIVNIAIISTHAPAGGATIIAECEEQGIQFLLTPLREGRRHDQTFELASSNFYSRPCGRGDLTSEGRRGRRVDFYSRPCGRGDASLFLNRADDGIISTHAPAGGATFAIAPLFAIVPSFLLTPLREGRPSMEARRAEKEGVFLLTPLREGRQQFSTSPS